MGQGEAPRHAWSTKPVGRHSHRLLSTDPYSFCKMAQSGRSSISNCPGPQRQTRVFRLLEQSRLGRHEHPVKTHVARATAADCNSVAVDGRRRGERRYQLINSSTHIGRHRGRGPADFPAAECGRIWVGQPRSSPDSPDSGADPKHLSASHAHKATAIRKLIKQPKVIRNLMLHAGFLERNSFIDLAALASIYANRGGWWIAVGKSGNRKNQARGILDKLGPPVWRFDRKRKERKIPQFPWRCLLTQSRC